MAAIRGDTRVTVRRTDGSQLVLDTATHRLVRVTYDPVLPGYSYRGDALLTYTGSSATLAGVYTNWNDVDPTDYLAGGYWMHLKGRTDPLTITGTEIGAFVDGPEISSPPTLPRLGTATYRGRAGGAYVYVSPSFSEVGEFTADMRLTANFASNTLSGCMGCGDLAISGVAEDASGRSQPFLGVSVPVRLRLGAAPIASDGTFVSRNVTFERDDRTVTSSRGSWRGRFSNNPSGTGAPVWRLGLARPSGRMRTEAQVPLSVPGSESGTDAIGRGSGACRPVPALLRRTANGSLRLPRRDLTEHSGDRNGVPRPCPVAFKTRYPIGLAPNICPSAARPSGQLRAGGT